MYKRRETFVDANLSATSCRVRGTTFVDIVMVVAVRDSAKARTNGLHLNIHHLSIALLVSF